MKTTIKNLDLTKRIEGLFDINEQISKNSPETVIIGGNEYTGWTVGYDEIFEDNGTEYNVYQYFVTTDGELFQLYYKRDVYIGMIDYTVVHAWRYVDKWYDDYDQETDDILRWGVQYWSDLCCDEEVFDG